LIAKSRKDYQLEVPFYLSFILFLYRKKKINHSQNPGLWSLIFSIEKIYNHFIRQSNCSFIPSLYQLIHCAKRAMEPQAEMQSKLGSWTALQIPLSILLKQSGNSHQRCSVMLEQPIPLQYGMSFLFAFRFIDEVITQWKVA